MRMLSNSGYVGLCDVSIPRAAAHGSISMLCCALYSVLRCGENAASRLMVWCAISRRSCARSAESAHVDRCPLYCTSAATGVVVSTAWVTDVLPSARCLATGMKCVSVLVLWKAQSVTDGTTVSP